MYTKIDIELVEVIPMGKDLIIIIAERNISYLILLQGHILSVDFKEDECARRN